MLLPAVRFAKWIANIAFGWKLPVGEWVKDWLVKSALGVLENMEPEAIELLKGNLGKIADHPATPQDIKVIISTLMAGKKPLPLLVIIPLAVLMLLPMITSIFQPLGNLLRYVQERLFRSYRLDPVAIITAWRRDKPKYEKFFDDLRDQGWTDERIEALKFFSLYYPAPADLIRWQAREVFEPEMIERYGLDSEFGAIEKEPFYKAGMTDEQILNFWRAHWEHASWQQVVEMLHRGLMTEEQVRDWFRVVEIPPFWRQLLIDSAYTWPTRVDVRRWWDMRTIDEPELRRLYSGMGYRGVNLDNYVLWTKVYVAFPDLIARWRNGWISLDDVKQELTGLGMPSDRVEDMIQTKIKPEAADRVSGERDITKTDIYKGVKQGIITRSGGIELLMELGFDEDEADYLLAINIPQDQEAVVVKDRELTKADILSGLKAAIITEAEALTRLESLRYRREDAETILSIFKAATEPPVEAWQREASKADIVAAVKQGLITPEKAYLMLLDIGFSAEASNFILMVRAEVSPFSPVNFGEFKNLTQKYRRAIGREAKPMSDEIIAAGALVVRLTDETESLQLLIKDEERGLIKDEAIPEAASARRDELRLALHRAQSELAAAQTNYDSLVAEWRHKE